MTTPTDASGARPARRLRPGFSFAELMITLAVAGIMTMLAAPKVVQFRERASVRAARQELTATIEAARGAALQRGRTARLFVRGDSALAVVDTGPPGLAASKTVLAPASFQRQYAVRVQLGTPADSLLTYDGRGLANPRLGRVARYIVVGATLKDSVCVASYGTILPRTCTP